MNSFTIGDRLRACLTREQHLQTQIEREHNPERKLKLLEQQERALDEMEALIQETKRPQEGHFF